MTLIASFQRPEGIVTISDVLLSSERARPPAAIDLPLRSRNLFHVSQEPASANFVSLPVGMAQKAVLLEPNGLVLWAGSKVIATSLIRDIAHASIQGRVPSLDEVIAQSGISRREADQVSLIAFLDRGDAIIQHVHQTERTERSFGSVVYAGTGSYPGILDFDDPHQSSDIGDFRRGYIDRLMLILAGELITRENGLFSFGGWFELASLATDGNFEKTSYAIKLWIVDGEQMCDGPGLISGYVGHDQVIFQLNRSAKSASRPYLIPDLLRRSRRAIWQGEAPNREHEFEIHVVHFNDLKRTAHVVLAGRQRAITCQVRPDTLAWSVEPEFLKTLVSELRTGTSSGERLSRLSMWKPCTSP